MASVKRFRQLGAHQGAHQGAGPELPEVWLTFALDAMVEVRHRLQALLLQLMQEGLASQEAMGQVGALAVLLDEAINFDQQELCWITEGGAQ